MGQGRSGKVHRLSGGLTELDEGVFGHVRTINYPSNDRAQAASRLLLPFRLIVAYHTLALLPFSAPVAKELHPAEMRFSPWQRDNTRDQQKTRFINSDS